MFTGLIETAGVIDRTTRTRAGAALVVRAPFAGELERGESVSIDGVCLTVVRAGGDTFEVDAVRTTLERTTLDAKRPGDRVNLERALRVGDRLGGHLVAGHVDTTAGVLSVREAGGARVVTFELPDEVARYVAPLGSIAVDGVSLTVAERDRDSFSVSLIPETLARTNAVDWRPGARVNLEADLIARQIEVLVGARRGEDGGGITIERLAALGFLGRDTR